MGVKSWILPIFLLQILFAKFGIAELEQNTERISGTLLVLTSFSLCFPFHFSFLGKFLLLLFLVVHCDFACIVCLTRLISAWNSLKK